jgi:hypothetical protein
LFQNFRPASFSIAPEEHDRFGASFVYPGKLSALVINGVSAVNDVEEIARHVCS